MLRYVFYLIFTWVHVYKSNDVILTFYAKTNPTAELMRNLMYLLCFIGTMCILATRGKKTITKEHGMMGVVFHCQWKSTQQDLGVLQKYYILCL